MRGPVLLRAHGTAQHPSGRPSGFRDEARGRILSWDLTSTLTAVIADFDPESRNNRPVVITPLGDLAWARAQGLQRAHGAELLEAYAESLELMARHFGLSTAEGVLYVRPAPADEAITPPPTEPVRYLLALGCLSRQALDIAHELGPEAIDGFTALDLLAAYRADVAADGRLDGREGVSRVMLAHAGRSRPLGDGFRTDLALACARWLAQPDNVTGLSVGLVVDQLRRIAHDESDLFPEGQAPAPFEDAPVEVRVEPRARGDGAVVAGETPDASRLAGTVALRVHARDPAGVVSVDAALDDAEPGALVVERPVPAPGALAATPDAEWVGLLDSSALTDGRHELAVTVTDALGTTERRHQGFIVDNTPPDTAVSVAPGAAGAVAGDRVTGTVRVRVEARDASRIATVDVVPPPAANAALVVEDASPDAWTGRLDTADLPDGPLTLSIVAADLLGNVADGAHTLVIDHTAPVLNVEVAATEDGRINGDRVAGVIAVQAGAVDAAGPIRLSVEAIDVPAEALADDRPVPAPPCDGPEPCTARRIRIDTRGLPDGPVTLHVTATDALGNSTVETLRLGVNNAPPTLAVEVAPGAEGAVAGDRVAGTVEVRVRARAPEGAPALTVGADLPPAVGGVLSGTTITGSAEEPDTTRWTGRLDTRALPDGPVTLRISAADAMGSRAERTLELTVDNTPPQLQVPPPAAIAGEAEGRWYTHAEALSMAVEAADPAGVGLTVELDGRPQPVDGSVAALSLPSEGLHTVEVVAVDALGNRTSTSRVLAVDRTPPALELLPSFFVDERQLDSGRRLADAPQVALSTEGEVRLSKWQNHWGPGDDNPVVARWRLSDEPSAGAGSTAEQLALVWTARIGDAAPGPPHLIPGGEERALEWTGAALGIDPIGDPPPTDTPARVHVEARDLAGNRASAVLALRLDVIPPPLEVTVVEGEPGNRTRVGEVSLADETFWRLFRESGWNGTEIVRVRVHNPHDLPVRASFEHAPSMLVDLALGVGVVGRTIAQMEADQVDHEGRRPQFESEVDAIEVVVHHLPDVECGLEELTFLDRYLRHRESEDEPLVGELVYSFYECFEAHPVVHGLWRATAPIEVLPEGAASGEERLVIGAGDSLTVRLVAEPLRSPAPIAAVTRAAAVPLLGYVLRYVEPIENSVLYADMPNAEVAYRLCSHCFEDEVGCVPACQPAGEWIGRRVRAITDVWIRSEGDTPWAVRSVSADGSLQGAAVRLPSWERRLRNRSLPIAWP